MNIIIFISSSFYLYIIENKLIQSKKKEENIINLYKKKHCSRSK